MSVSVQWNGTRAWERNKKVALTAEQLEELGATGESMTVLAKRLGICQQRLSAIVNKSLTNRQAFDKGRSKSNGKRTSKI